MLTVIFEYHLSVLGKDMNCSHTLCISPTSSNCTDWSLEI